MRLAAKPRIGGMDSQPRPSGPTKPGGPQEPGAGRTAMCRGKEATRRQPHRPDGRGLFDAIPVPRLDRGQKPARPSDSGLPESEVPSQNRCRAKRAPTGLDWCPSGWRYGQAPARLSRGVPSGRWPRMSWRQRRLSSNPTPHHSAKPNLALCLS